MTGCQGPEKLGPQAGHPQRRLGQMQDVDDQTMELEEHPQECRIGHHRYSPTVHRPNRWWVH